MPANSRLSRRPCSCPAAKSRRTTSRIRCGCFNNQQRLQIDRLPTYGRGLGINDARFASCIKSDATQVRVNSDKQERARVGVSGTPGFLIGQVLGNSQVRLLRRFKGAAPLTTFRAMIEAVEKASRR